MPTWIDLSEHKAALNVYQSTEGKVLILRALSSDHPLPETVLQLGFEQRDGHFIRSNLRFSLQDIQKHFPLAKSREFSSAEIFYVPVAAPAHSGNASTSNETAEPKAPWQMTSAEWHRARELAGNVKADEPATHLEVVQKAIAEGKHVPFDVVAEYPELFEAADAAPDVTPRETTGLDGDDTQTPPVLSTAEIKSVRKKPGTERLIRHHEVQRFGRHGFVSEYFVAFVDGRYPTTVEALERDQAIEFARRERGAHEKRSAAKEGNMPTHPLYADGRRVPALGETVFDYRGGFGGSPVLVRGEVVSRGGGLQVKISGTVGMFNESVRNTSEPLGENWTVQGEEHPYERKMREFKERDERARRQLADERQLVQTLVQSSKDAGNQHLDDTQPAIGTAVEDVVSGTRAVVAGYHDFGAGPEPLLRVEGEDSERTTGNEEFRSRYRICTPVPQPWNVTLRRFAAEARHEAAQGGGYQVVFGDLKFPTSEKNPDKAIRAVHKDQVRSAYAANKAVGLAVMVDYPEVAYSPGERAASNVSKLIASLGIGEKLMEGELQHVRLVNPPYVDLIIERLPDPEGSSLYLTHYLESAGDRFIESEMVFSIRPDGGLVLSETAIQNPVRGGEMRGRDTSFANMFSKNLLDQGFNTAKAEWKHDDAEPDDKPPELLQQGIELVQAVGTEFGGVFSEWEASDPSVVDQWRYSNLTIGDTSVRIAVSEGGVVQVNGDPFTPGDRIMNVTRDAVVKSVKAALPQLYGQDLEHAQKTMREMARTLMPAEFTENVTSSQILQMEGSDGEYKVRFSVKSTPVKTEVSTDVLRINATGAATIISSAHIPVLDLDVVTATTTAVEAANTYLKQLLADSPASDSNGKVAQTAHNEPSDVTAAVAAARLPGTAPQRLPLYGISTEYEAQRYCLPRDFYAETTQNGYAFYAPADRYRTPEFTSAESAMYAAHRAGDKEAVNRHRTIMGVEMRKMVNLARESLPSAQLAAAVLRPGDRVRFTPDPALTSKNKVIIGTISHSVRSSSGSPGFEILEDGTVDRHLTRVWATEGTFSILQPYSDDDAFVQAREAAMKSYDNPHRIEALIREMVSVKGQTMAGEWADRFAFSVTVPSSLPDLVELMGKQLPTLTEMRNSLSLDKLAERDLPTTDFVQLAEKQLATIRAFRGSFTRLTQPRIHDIRMLDPDSPAAFEALEHFAQAIDEAEETLGRYEKKAAAQQEAEEQAKWEKYEPYQQAGRVTKPPAAKIGFTKAWMTEQNGWFQVRNGDGSAWSNGHLFDLGDPHYTGFTKFHSARYSGMPIEQRPNIAHYTTLETAEQITPAFVQRQILKDRDAVLLVRPNDKVVGIDKLYYDYIVSKYPSATFHISANWVAGGNTLESLVHAKVGGAVVAGVMPMRGTDTYTASHIRSKIDLYRGPSQQEPDDVDAEESVDVHSWEFVSKQRAGTRAAASATIKVAEIDGRWYGAIDTMHNQGSHAGRMEPLTPYGRGYDNMNDARFDAGNRIVIEQRQIAERGNDSMTTDKQRAVAREMAEWALQVILPAYKVRDIVSGPYQGWKRATVNDGRYQGKVGIGPTEQEALENLRERLDLHISGDLQPWRSIGVNREGLPIEEDPAGVRAIIRSGVRIAETVSVTPYGVQLELETRDLDYLTESELRAVRQDASKQEVKKADNGPQISAPGPDPEDRSPRVGDVLSGATVNALVDGIPVSFRQKKVSRYDKRAELAGKTCTWANAFIDGEWRSLGEPWPHFRPANAELAIAIRHAKANPEEFDGDALLDELNREIEEENAGMSEQRMRVNTISSAVFKLTKIDGESFELRFKDLAQPYSVLIEYQSPGVYMPSRRKGGTGPRTTLRHAISWAARELTDSKMYYERAIVEQRRDLPCLETDLESFRAVFGTQRDDQVTVQGIREQFPDPVPEENASVFARQDRIKIPEAFSLRWTDDRTVVVSIVDPAFEHEIQIRGMGPDESGRVRNRWTASGALSRAIAAIETELTWARAKASRPDEGVGLDELAQRQADFMRAHDPERHNGIVSKMHREFALAITDKDYDFLIGWLARPKGSNDLSKKFFTQVTGIKLPSTARDIKTALYQWAGYDPQEAQRMEAEKRRLRDISLQQQEAERKIRYLVDSMESTRVMHNGVEKSGRAFIDDIIDAGFDSLETRRVGAVDRYRLVNKTEERLYQLKGNMVDYARHALKLRAEAKLAPADECVPSLRP